jgi:acetyl-CoA synthetase
MHHVHELPRLSELSTADALWDAVEATAADPELPWFNSAHECVDRWVGDPSAEGDRPAIIFRTEDGGRDVWTYRRLRDASRQLAGAFVEAGLERGDRVGGILTKQPETYVTALACWRAGMIYVPMFIGLGTDGLVHRARAGQLRAVVVDAAQRGSWEAAARQLDHPPTVWSNAPPAEQREGDIDFWATLDKQVGRFETVHTRIDEPATMMFTSGTTGLPKGCTIPHGALLALRPFVHYVLDLHEDDVHFAGADPGWSYGLYTVGLAVVAMGHRIVIARGNFDPEKWLAVMREEKVTFMAVAPSALRRLVAVATAQGGLPESIRHATCAGEPLDATLHEAWKRLKPDADLRDGYGQTEAGMIVCNLAGGEPIVSGALNAAVPGFDMVLLPEDGGDTPLEGPATGVFAMRRPRYQMSNMYWNQPDKWAARWRGDFWITGDVARRDENGRYWFVGREDDLIITSGYNVGPTEVEAVILADDEVREVAVVAAADEARGSVVRAVVVAEPGADTEALSKRIQERVRVAVGRHAYPRIIDYVDDLPRTETGKVKKAALRQARP